MKDITIYQNNIEFQKVIFEKIQSRIQSESCLEDMRAVSFEYYINEYQRRLISRLTLEHYERIAESKEVEFFIERPSFIEWLFRKTKTKKVTITLKEIFKGSVPFDGQPYIEVIKVKEL